jgi:hypothetical protein
MCIRPAPVPISRNLAWIKSFALCVPTMYGLNPYFAALVFAWPLVSMLSFGLANISRLP